MGAFGALLITIIKRKMSWKVLSDSLSQTTQTTAMVFLILIGAHIFGYFLTISQIPDQLAILASDVGLNRYIILTMLVFAYMISKAKTKTNGTKERNRN